MKSVTFHVTDLDSYLWYQRIEDMTADDLKARLLRTALPREEMLLGTAWHAILEDPPEDSITDIKRNGYLFTVACDAKIVLPQIREVRASKDYIVDGVKVTLTGKVDGITGNRVDDHKLTFHADLENYLTSYQWPAYLDIFDAYEFQYIVYHAAKQDNHVWINEVSKMSLYRYPEMADDLMDGISNLLAFVSDHVPEMIRQAA